MAALRARRGGRAPTGGTIWRGARSAPCRRRLEQRRCHSLTATTTRRPRRLRWRRGVLAVVDARLARREGLLARRGLLRGVGGVAFEGATGGLVAAGGEVDHRPPGPGPQEPVDGLQPAFLAGSSTRLPAGLQQLLRFMRSATCASSRRYYRAAAPVSASSCCQEGGGGVSGLSTPDTGTGLIASGSLL